MTGILVTDPAALTETDVLAQLAYHMRCSAGLAADGDRDACVPHAVLAWALLEAVGGQPLHEAIDALDLPDDLGDVHGGSRAFRRPTAELALQLCAHFTSEGRHDLAGLYQHAYQLVAPA
jgi:hypothetical protein